uniref:Uncharacterized protein LOC114349472 n=1 Tax=Diabrotica virgifera virgifera TaxID=50390 RepID=A0A6P7H0Z2_DIAVI
MENIDGYLHKKFKKQVNVDTKIQNDKENKESAPMEQGEEKADQKENQREAEYSHEEYAFEKNQQRSDNNQIVPNQSTKNSTVNSSNCYKSSISVGNPQSSNSYISYVVSKQPDHHQPTSFDIKFNNQQTKTNYTTVISKSSILNVYPTNNFKYTTGDQYIPFPSTTPQEETKPEELLVPKPDEQRNSGGKYVCPYCNLVCSKPSVLQKHIRAHTNERPYPCESCGFSFKTRSNLYKHCRSRTHANRLMGTKTQEGTTEPDVPKSSSYSPTNLDDLQKPYKPRFHTKHFDNIPSESVEDEEHYGPSSTSEFVSHHINEIISRNNSIVSSNDQGEFRYSKEPAYERSTDEPLNLTKSRKRSMSEVTEPVIQKSLIKELLLKNLSASDMQCPYCKMIFQTVTELDVHKYRSCKGKPHGAKYTRSSSVNVASILTHNKNAFDNIPQMQFPLNSPGPFLGKTRLIESDKTKSFSFDSGNMPLISPGEPSPSPNYLLSPLPFDRDKKPGVKLFGGEVKVHSSGETKSFKIDGSEDKYEKEVNYIDYGSSLSENRVVKTSLQSGGTVLTNTTNYKPDLKTPKDVIMMSPSVDFNKRIFTFDKTPEVLESMQDSLVRPRALSETSKSYPDESSPLYKNIMDFSQKALKKLTPNIKQPTLNVPSKTISIIENVPIKPITNQMILEPRPELNILSPKPKLTPDVSFNESKPNLYNPLNLFVNGKVVRHVPGMPGPVVAAEAPPVEYSSNIIAVARTVQHSMAPLSPLVVDRTPLTPLIVDRSPLTPKLAEIYTQQEKNGTRFFLQPDRLKSPNNLQMERVLVKSSGNFLQPEKFNERMSRSPKSDSSETSTKTNKSLEQSLETKSVEEVKKFIRPNSLALKPTMASLKQHHGLTPTMFNQILISPDTPRVAKKYAQHFLHGNYFSYLGLKSSTRPVYCTLNKTQPFYVPYFKKLSMYSEWRQQDTKQDKLYVSNYDSRQKGHSYSIAGKTSPNLIIHSSYKFVVSETLSKQLEKEDEPQKTNTILGGYECNEDYIYVRGRGRGRYVCDQCGIRCKKPSMLKKHIRTHSNDRPYTCSHCNFSFKTKGNLTKHMKSKAHSKNSTTSTGSSSSSAQQSAQSSESDTDDSGMDSSDESTRQQEHEAAYGLLSLSQKPSQPSSGELSRGRSKSPTDTFMTTEEIAHVSKANYAKNKILDEQNTSRNSGFKNVEVSSMSTAEETTESQNYRIYLGMGSGSRPLTYPYTTILTVEKEMMPSPKIIELDSRVSEKTPAPPEQKSIKQFHVIQKYVPQSKLSPRLPENNVPVSRKVEYNYSPPEEPLNNTKTTAALPSRPLPTLKINDVVVSNENAPDARKRKVSVTYFPYKRKVSKSDEVMDLSMANNHEKIVNGVVEENILNNFRPIETQKNVANEIFNALQKPAPPPRLEINEDMEEYPPPTKSFELSTNNNGAVLIVRPMTSELPEDQTPYNEESAKSGDFDNSAMETLADIATKQVKLEKNTLAKSVASEFLKLATKIENADGSINSVNFGPINKDVNDIIVKSEGNKSCTICLKSFNKPSQLRLHMNIHYLERPFRCDSCSVSFRTKGHLQKHERSASHHNKLSSSPALSSSEPRPFKCSDCSIAFRIHGHLAKHLRSKMHIQRLECLKKLPFGLYAELERSNSLLTEINTCDGDQCLESLKMLAKKVFINHPNKLTDIDHRENISAD